MARNRRLDEGSPVVIRCLFAAGLLAFAFLLQYSAPALGSLDGYFHIRYSAMLAAGGWRGFPPAFPWLPLTILAPERYFDHHMLFHLWLVPFARGDLIAGAKLAAALGAAAALLSAYAFLLWRRVRRAEWWMVALLAAAPGFLYRMEMPRAQSWAVVFLVAGLALAIARRDVRLLPLAWLFTWSYDAFPALLAVAASAAAARWALEREPQAWRPLAFTAGGIGLGLLVNPYFPNDLRFITHHLLERISPSEGVAVGVEWDRLALAEWIGWGGLAALLTALGAVLYRRRAGLDAARLTAILTAVCFAVLLWQAARFVEYFAPMAAIAVAMSLHEPVDELLRHLDLRWRRAVAAALVVGLIASSGVAGWQLRGRPPASRYQVASAWIAANTPPGAMVFNASWDDFALLFFHNPANHYVIGLDPSYLARRDAARYRRWRQLRDGELPEPARVIQDDFGAVVAVADRRDEAFIRAMDTDPLAERAHADADGVVYRLHHTATASPTP